MTHAKTSFLALGLALAAAACSESTAPPADGGGVTDAPVTVPLPTCALPRFIAGMVGTVTITGDTSPGPSGPLDLGPRCNNQGMVRWAPQEVIAYEVPGTGPMGVEFSTVDPRTPDTFDTLVQVRRDCATIPALGVERTCFDDVGGGEFRTAGGFMAMGGDTVYLIVTGYSETPIAMGTDHGPYTLTITAGTNEAPVVTAATLLVLGTTLRIRIDGTDADGNVGTFRVLFKDAAGMAVDQNMSGAGDANDAVRGRFREDLSGMTAFSGTGRSRDTAAARPSLMVTQADVTVLDRAELSSAPLTVPVVMGTLVGLGATCNTTNICGNTLSCTAGVCVAAPEVVTACMGATPITIATPTTTTTSTTVTGMLDPGTGVIAGSCAATGGPELIFSVDVPAGAFDLLATTNLAGSTGTDTVLFVRSVCADPATEVACHDDIDRGMMQLSNVEVLDAAAGTYSVFIEQFVSGTLMSKPYEMQVSLRPVLATGTACDALQVDNRCATGPCPAGASPVCP